MQETSIERNMINITEVIEFHIAELILTELEMVSTEIEGILNRKYRKGSLDENKNY